MFSEGQWEALEGLEREDRSFSVRHGFPSFSHSPSFVCKQSGEAGRFGVLVPTSLTRKLKFAQNGPKDLKV